MNRVHRTSSNDARSIARRASDSEYNRLLDAYIRSEELREDTQASLSTVEQQSTDLRHALGRKGKKAGYLDEVGKKHTNEAASFNGLAATMVSVFILSVNTWMVVSLDWSNFFNHEVFQGAAIALLGWIFHRGYKWGIVIK